MTRTAMPVEADGAEEDARMEHLLIAPVVLPALVAPFIIMVLRHHLDLHPDLLAGQRGAAGRCHPGPGRDRPPTAPCKVYELGDWPAPFGIVLVLDRLSAMMIVLTSLLALA